MPRKVQILPRDFNAYRHRVNRNTVTFDCPICGKWLLSKEYEKHCSECHRIDVKHTCVWCREFTWDKREKITNASHLYVCYEKFMQSRYSTDGFLNLRHEFCQKTLYNFSNLPTSEEHDSIWPLETDPAPITFRDENLNLAASYVLKFILLRNTHDWFHVMVRAVAFKSFTRAVNDDRGNSRTLAFSCWCNGGVYERPEHRQHRHLVVVSPKNHFVNNVWPKVKISDKDKPNRNFQCKMSKRIDSLMHFVNTLGYLSHRKSRCAFTFKETKSTPFGMHHFYLYRTLPVCYRLPLVLFWDNGIYELLYQEKFQNVSVSKLMQHPVEFVDGRWKQKIGDFYGLERGLILPVSKRFVATKQDTPFYLHLMHGKKLHFESDAENESLDHDAWMKRQKENGNVFYEAVKDEWWTPRLKDQTHLNTHMPVVRQRGRFERETETLKKKMEEERAETESIKTENERLRRRLEEANAETESKKIELERLRGKLEEADQEIRSKKIENECLKRKLEDANKEILSKQLKIDTLYEKNENLHTDINTVYKTEMAKSAEREKAYKEQIVNLKRQNKFLLEKLTLTDTENKRLKLKIKLLEASERLHE